MIQLMFDFANENILVVITGNDVKFGNTSFGTQMATIDGLRLDYSGVVRQFPDLEVKDDWKEEAIKRFKKKIKNCKTEEEIANYLIEDLKLHGYKARKKQKDGFRSEVLNG